MIDVTRESSGNRPDRTGIERLQQQSMRRKPRNPPIPIEEWMHPQKSVVSSGNRDHDLCFAYVCVYGFKTGEEARDRARTDRHEMPDLHVPLAELTGHHSKPFTCLRIFHPQKVVWKQAAETPMDFANTICLSRLPAVQSAAIDPRLNRYVSLRLVLQIALASIRAIFTSERTFNLDRMSIVSFDQV